VIVDVVGVTEAEFNDTKPLDRFGAWSGMTQGPTVAGSRLSFSVTTR